MENDEPIESSTPEPFEQEKPKSGIIREPDQNAPQSRKAFVREWQDKVLRAKRHWGDSHTRMREDMDFFMGKQWPHGNGDKYVANLVQRHVQQRVASLYAKNPKAVAKRRETIDFILWDENPGTLQVAQTNNDISLQSTGMPSQESMAILQDVTEGFASRNKADKVAKTLEIIFHKAIEDQNLKQQMKQMVRRTCVTGVGYLKVGYHRVMDKRPEDVEKITDITEQLKALERLTADKQDDKFDEDSARAEQLRGLLHELSEKQEMVVDEGLTFDFPQSQNIILDTRCRQLKGFIGAEWVAQEFILTLDEVKEIYGIDLGTSYTRQEHEGANGDAAKSEAALSRVWEIYSKVDGMKYVVADGYSEFLVEPACPEIVLKRFWPFFVLTFNEVENDKEIYPPSDVRLLTPIQREYNLARQRLREHRNANRPLYVTPTGALSEADIRKLTDRQANEVVQLQAIQPGQSVDQVLQPVKAIPIDPALYDTSFLLDDLYRVVGSQEANMGGTSSSTATEVSVAESSRMSALGSNVDDLDEFLIEVSRASGQILLTMMNPETATKIAGRGAIWPTLSAQEISDQLFLEIEAGSTGRPNRASEIAALERLFPVLSQVPGIDPSWLAKVAVRAYDSGVDLTDAIKTALPSIMAMNAQKQQSTGNPETDPNAQGAQGAMNAPAPAAAAGNPAGVQVPNVPAANLYNEGPPPPNVA
jgi:hypothetical protein